MSELSFYGGVDEIGGNKILLEDKGTRIFIDFGLQMGTSNQYFGEFMKPRKSVGMDDLFAFKLLPDIHGIYRLDYSKHSNYDMSDTSIHGVLLSHAHVDHCAYIQYLRPEIPIYCTEASKLIMQAFDDKGRGDQYMTYKENFRAYENNKGDLSRAKKPEHRDEIDRNFSIIHDGKKFKIDSIEVEPIAIDHSLPGECGFIIYTSDCTIGYTGDIRFHGRRAKSSENFLNKCGKAGLDYILCEGTRIDRCDKKTEADVETKAQSIIENTKDLVVCSYPPRDLDRMLSFYNAVKNTERKLVIDTNQAHLLKLFSESKEYSDMYPNPKDENICVYMDRKSWGLIGKTFDDPRYDKLLMEDYATWEKGFLDYDNTVNYTDIREKQKDHVFFCSDFKLQSLLDVKPKENSSYIRSLTEPFNGEMELDHDKVRRWLAHVGLLQSDKKWTVEHVSGHGDATQLERVVKETNAKTLIPIHTEHADHFNNIHSNVCRPTNFQSMSLN